MKLQHPHFSGDGKLAVRFGEKEEKTLDIKSGVVDVKELEIVNNLLAEGFTEVGETKSSSKAKNEAPE